MTPPEDNEDEEEIAECFAITSNLAVLSKVVPHIDDNYITICQGLQKDIMIAKLPTDHPAKLSKHVWQHLSTDGTLLFMGNRIVIPTAAQPSILNMLHMPHNGIVKT